MRFRFESGFFFVGVVPSHFWGSENIKVWRRREGARWVDQTWILFDTGFLESFFSHNKVQVLKTWWHCRIASSLLMCFLALAASPVNKHRAPGGRVQCFRLMIGGSPAPVFPMYFIDQVHIRACCPEHPQDLVAHGGGRHRPSGVRFLFRAHHFVGHWLHSMASVASPCVVVNCANYCVFHLRCGCGGFFCITEQTLSISLLISTSPPPFLLPCLFHAESSRAFFGVHLAAPE